LKLLESFTINNVVNNVAIECNEIFGTVIFGYQFHAFQNFKILLIPLNMSRQRVPKRRNIKFSRRGMTQRKEYQGADKSLTRLERKQARKHVRYARDFNNIETRAVIKFFFPARQSAEGNSHHSGRNIGLFPSWSG